MKDDAIEGSRSQTELRVGIGIAGLLIIGCFVAAAQLAAHTSDKQDQHQPYRVADAG